MNIKRAKFGIFLPTIITKNGTAKQSLELARELEKKGYQIVFISFIYISQTSFNLFRDFSVKSMISGNRINWMIKLFPLVFLEQVFLYVQFLLLPFYKSFINRQHINICIANDWFTMWCVSVSRFKNKIAIINDVPERKNGLINKIKLVFDRKCVKGIQRFFVLDYKNKHKLMNWLGELVLHKTFVLRSGIDKTLYQSFTDQFDIRKRLKLNPSSYIFVCANFMARHRRYEDVIQAFSKLKNKYSNIYLLILTKLDFDKRYSGEILKLIDSLKIHSSIYILDKYFLTSERMNYIHQSNVLIFPNYPQTWGLTVLEAMALGVPTIVSTGSGVSEVLRDKENAIIYQAGSVEKLYEAMEYCLKNKRHIVDIVKSGIKLVYSRFTYTTFATKLISKIV